MPHFSGDKISSSHSTIIKAAEPIVKHLQKNPFVKKISLGRIDRSGSGTSPRRAKVVDESGCILIEVARSSSFQEIRVFTDDRLKVKKSLTKFLEDNDYDVRFHDRRTDKP